MIFKKKSKAKCPYCGIEVKKTPKKKKKCPNCKEPIYPRTNPYTNKLYYLTEEGKEEMEKIRDRHRAEERFFEEFKEYGLTKKDFEKRRKDYEKKARKLNQEYDTFAFLISVFNELTQANI